MARYHGRADCQHIRPLINKYYIMALPVRILMIGDVVGETGLKMVCGKLPELVASREAEFVIVNGENVYDGKGIRPADAAALFAAGAHVITSGNHIWDRWQSKEVLANNRNVLRPLNYPLGNVGNGWAVRESGSGTRIAVLNLQGRTYMQSIDCPFRSADWALGKIGAETRIVIVDFHAEATAEKIAFGYYVDGRVSAVVGTHTHVQTNDARILPGGTAFLSDVGMSGGYDSIIGVKKEAAIKRFMAQTPHQYEVADGDPRIAGVLLEVDPESGKALYIEPFMYPDFQRRSPGLAQATAG